MCGFTVGALVYGKEECRCPASWRVGEWTELTTCVFPRGELVCVKEKCEFPASWGACEETRSSWCQEHPGSLETYW